MRSIRNFISYLLIAMLMITIIPSMGPVALAADTITNLYFEDNIVLDFDESTTEYTVVVPWSKANGYVLPELKWEPATADVAVTGGLDEGALSVTDGTNTYTINLNKVGENMYENGGAENGEWTEVWCVFDLVTNNPGAGNNSILLKGNGYYTPDATPKTLTPNVTYLASSMIRKNENYEQELSVYEEVKSPGDGGTTLNFDGSFQQWNADGSARSGEFPVSSTDWLTHYRTILPNSNVQVVDQYCNTAAWKPQNLVVDEYFLGELVVSDVELTDTDDLSASEVGLPDDSVEIELTAAMYNQLGNRAGLGRTDATVSSWNVQGNPMGISVDDGVVTVTSKASLGTYYIEAEVETGIAGTEQTKAKGIYTLTIVEPVDYSGAELADILVGNLSVPNFSPRRFNYKVYVPYTYKANNFRNYKMPEITPIPKKGDSDIVKNTTGTADGGEVVITVTSADGEMESVYRLNLEIVGENLYADGGFEEEGTWSPQHSTVLTRTQESPAAGEWAMIVGRPKGNGYYGATKMPLLTGGWTYITQSMVKAVPGVEGHETYNNFDGVTPSGDNPTAQIKYYDAMGGARQIFKTTDEWQKAYSVITPKNNYAVNNHFTIWGQEDDIVIDEYFVGELSIANMTYIGENVGIIPASGDEPYAVRLGATFVNQFGTKIGLDNEKIQYELVEPYPGVTISGNTLYVSDDAVVGSFRLRAYVEPTFRNTQGKVSTSTEITLSVSANASGLPQAKNVTLTGEVIEDEVLVGDYDYYQINDEDEGESIYKWYSENLDGTGRTEIIANAGKLEFTVTSDYIEKRIYFEVTPVMADGTVGPKSISDYICKPMAPYAINVKVTGDRCIGGTLKGSYDYIDPNSDAEDVSGTSFAWLRSADGITDFKAIDEATADTYVITEDDIGKYLVFSVKPMAVTEPAVDLDKSYDSEPILAADIPVVSNVAITKVNGGTYKVTYDYSHPTGVSEGDTKVVWQVNGSTSDTTNNTITVDTGKTTKLKVTVTPYASKAPFEGEAVSDSIEIESSGKGSVKVSKGSGGGGSVFVPLPEVKVEEPVVEAPKHWAEDGIAFCKANGIMQDVAQGDFGNTQIVTRAELVTYIIKTLGEKDAAYAHRFYDVKSTDYFAGSLQKAVDLGIISEADNFEPHRNVTRQEVAKIFVAAFGQDITTKADLTKFADNALISDWAQDWVSKCVSKGILKGVSDYEFNPLGSITREQTAVLLKRLYDLRNGGIIE